MKNAMPLALAALALVSTGCSDNKGAAEKTTTTTAPAATAPAAPASDAPATATAYTCPMHPEVVSSQPGKCPKCNMDLVVKK